MLYRDLAFLSVLSIKAVAQFDLSRLYDDTDLTSFVTRPEIKAPRFNITVHDADSLEDGYWFIGPYANLVQPRPFGTMHYTCQSGPHIFDQTGELIWSGACQFENAVACDVRAFEANGTSFISAIMTTRSDSTKGYAVILDNTYKLVKRLEVLPGMSGFNMHELTYVDDGTRALYIVNRPKYVGLESMLHDVEGSDSGWVLDLGIHEIDLATGETKFLWWATDHIDLEESSATFEDYKGRGWNWLHINSVNKNSDGDYIISARFTNAIYKISGQTGKILWRLGGTNSTFEMTNFNFARQHDAQWLSYNDDIEIISLLDNAADNLGFTTGLVSAAMVIRLDKTSNPPHAILTEKIERPDAGVSELRGNVQFLPNGNRFIGWSDNAYITEHAPDGRILMSATYASHRFVTYRAYKLPFEGFPAEPIALVVSAHQAGASSVTVYHVSWNGATNIKSWRFWRVVDGAEAPVLIGDAPRTGFETAYDSEGCEKMVYVEAIDHHGKSLGRSDPVHVKQPAPRIETIPLQDTSASTAANSPSVHRDEL